MNHVLPCAHMLCPTSCGGVGQSTPGPAGVFNPSACRLSFLASVVTLCARYMLDLPDKARQDYCHLCTRYTRLSLSLSLTVCICILQALELCLSHKTALQTYPQFLPAHLVISLPQVHPHCISLSILLNHFLYQLPHHEYILHAPSASSERCLLSHWSPWSSVTLHTCCVP